MDLNPRFLLAIWARSLQWNFLVTKWLPAFFRRSNYSTWYSFLPGWQKSIRSIWTPILQAKYFEIQRVLSKSAVAPKYYLKNALLLIAEPSLPRILQVCYPSVPRTLCKIPSRDLVIFETHRSILLGCNRQWFTS